MKDLLLRYGIQLGKRFTYPQKVTFINCISKELMDQGYEVSLQVSKVKGKKVTNVIVGDFEKANIVLMAGYDTPEHLFFGKYNYYPFNDSLAKRQEGSILFKKSIVMIILLVLLIGLLNGFIYFKGILQLVFITLFILLLLLFLSYSHGLSNKINMNSNSSAVCALLQLCYANVNLSNVAFVFLDQMSSSHLGLIQFEKWMDKSNVNNRLYFLLQSLSCDKDISFVSTRKHKTVLEELRICTNELNCFTKIFENNTNIFATIDNLVVIAGGEKENHQFVVKNTRSNNDYSINVERLEKLVDCINNWLKHFERK